MADIPPWIIVVATLVGFVGSTIGAALGGWLAVRVHLEWLRADIERIESDVADLKAMAGIQRRRATDLARVRRD